MFPYKAFEEVEREKIRRRSKKEIKQCVNCGSFKNLTDGETITYTKDRDLQIVAICDVHCKKSFVKKEIDDLRNKIEWLKDELKE